MSGDATRVYVRCRPRIITETKNDEPIANLSVAKPGAKIASDSVTIERVDPVDDSRKPYSFEFDSVFSPEVTQDEVYFSVFAPLVEDAVNGQDSTAILYGAERTGKRFTMEGLDNERPRGSGMSMLSILSQTLFDSLDEARARHPEREYELVLSCYYSYQESIHDLLGMETPFGRDNRVRVREARDVGTYLDKLTRCVVRSPQECKDIIGMASLALRMMITHVSMRHSAITKVWRFGIRTSIPQASDAMSESDVTTAPTRTDSTEHGLAQAIPGLVRESALNIVLWQRSNRPEKITTLSGQQLREASSIGKSVSCLGNIVSALSASPRARHIPYRDSQMTRVLRDSLGGPARCHVLCTVSPCEKDFEDTLSTLRFAHRWRKVESELKPREFETPTGSDPLGTTVEIGNLVNVQRLHGEDEWVEVSRKRF